MPKVLRISSWIEKKILVMTDSVQPKYKSWKKLLYIISTKRLILDLQSKKGNNVDQRIYLKISH